MGQVDSSLESIRYQGQWHLLFGVQMNPWLQKKNLYIKKKLLVYFMLKNIFAYIGWNLAHSDHKSIQPKTKQQLDI